MPKIYYIEPVGGRGGMYYYDFALCESLLKQGVDVTLITSEETRERSVPGSLELKYLFTGLYGKKSIVRRGRNYIKSLLNIWKAIKEEIGVVHLHFFQIPLIDFLFIVLLKKRKFRIIITAHDVIPFNAKFYTKFFIKHIYRTADKIIVHAQNNKKELIEKFQLAQKSIEVIPHGNYLPFIESHLGDREDSRAYLGIDKDLRVILFFGQIKKVKGLDYLIRATREVLQIFPQSILLIAGRIWKDDFSKYAELISMLGIEDKVFARIDYIPDAEVPHYFRATDVVVLPYTRIYQSGVLLMAYSYARPVVASSIGGMAEVVQDGVTGFLVPPKDEKKLAEAIVKVLSNKEQAENMGRSGRTLVEKKYSWDKIAEKTKNVYVRVLDAN